MLISRTDISECRARDGVWRQNASLYAPQTHIFLVRATFHLWSSLTSAFSKVIPSSHVPSLSPSSAWNSSSLSLTAGNEIWCTLRRSTERFLVWPHGWTKPAYRSRKSNESAVVHHVRLCHSRFTFENDPRWLTLWKLDRIAKRLEGAKGYFDSWPKHKCGALLHWWATWSAHLRTRIHTVRHGRTWKNSVGKEELRCHGVTTGTNTWSYNPINGWRQQHCRDGRTAWVKIKCTMCCGKEKLYRPISWFWCRTVVNTEMVTFHDVFLVGLFIIAIMTIPSPITFGVWAHVTHKKEHKNRTTWFCETKNWKIASLHFLLRIAKWKNDNPNGSCTQIPTPTRSFSAL